MAERSVPFDDTSSARVALGRARIAHRLTVDMVVHLDRWKDCIEELPRHFGEARGPSVRATHAGWQDDISWRTDAVQVLLLDIITALEPLVEE